VVSAGLALLVWVLIMQPLAADGSSHLLLRVVSVSYPIGDVLVFSLLAALMFGRSTRNSADYLMAASLLAFLVGDFSWAVFNQVNFNPNWLVADALQAVFLFALAAMGAAGLHPAMKGIDLPVGTAPDRLTRKRLTAMCVATMVAPGILALESLRGRVIDGTAVAAGSVVLFVLVIARLAEVVRRVEAQSRRLEELVTVDTLTGVANRRALETELPGFMADSDRTGDHLCLAVLDIDHFKTFNDEYGHQAGDRLLKATVEAWQRELRARDCLIRYGGDEFLVVLPRTGKADASSVLERLRVGMPLGQTLSGGLAEWDGSETPDQLLRRADDALYAAKRAGRKRVEVAPGGRVVGPVGLAQAG
jgi:diguanylate cyclase (GGDEF)-like protein